MMTFRGGVPPGQSGDSQRQSHGCYCTPVVLKSVSCFVFGERPLTEPPYPLTAAANTSRERLLPRVVEALHCAVAVAGVTDGRIRAANAAWISQVHAGACNDPAGMCLNDLFPEAGHLTHSTPGDAARRAVRLAASPGGAATWWDLDIAPHPDADGLVLVTARDATDRVLARREAEDAREAIEPIGNRLRLAQEAAGIGTWEWDGATDTMAWSPEQFRLHGVDPALGAPASLAAWLTLVHPADRPRILNAMDGYRPGESTTHHMEFRVRRADTGEERWLLAVGRVLAFGPDGRPAHMLGVNLDITRGRAQQDALRESEARLGLAAAAARVHAWDWDIASGRVTWFGGLEQELGLPPGGFGGTLDAFRALVHPADMPGVEAALQKAVSGETDFYAAEFRMFRADGTLRWAAARGTVVRDSNGLPLRVVGIDHDITDFKAIEAALHTRERQQAAVAALGQFAMRAPGAQAVMDHAVEVLTETLKVEFAKVLELAPDGQELVLRAGSGWKDAYPIGQATVSAGRGSQAGYTLLQDAGPVIVEDLTAETRFDGPPMLRDHSVLSGMSVVIRGAGEGDPPFGVLGVHTASRRGFTGHDIRFLEAVANILTAAIQRCQNETGLLRRKAALRALVETIPAFTFTASPDGRNEYYNQRWTDYCGLSAEQAEGLGWAEIVHPEDRQSTLDAWSRAVATGETYEREHRLRGRDGHYRWFLTRAVPGRAPDDGRILRWLGTSTDISSIVRMRDDAVRQVEALEARVTERTRALSEAAKELGAEMRRRQEAQAALLQSQKLEALGQLTAGVAHDFNNLLSVILGSFELIARRSREPKVKDLAENGRNAGKRAASLIRQLLDFGRHEPHTSIVVELLEALPEADQLIGHAIGPHIERVMDVQSDVWPVLADRHQLEVALLNLAINARDAMPGGGTLTLSARNLAPAERPEKLRLLDCVAIGVRDIGIGMPESLLARANEPFFTTKAAGKGTGLGLPMVQAFAERSGGCLLIHSTPSVGTIVEIVLPRAAVTAMAFEAAHPEAAEPLPCATLLLVDQDDQLRQIMAGYLRAQGYRVIEAPNAEAAVVLSHSIETLDLLLTDVTAPGASGPDLAARLRADRPVLPVLFMTAGADEAGPGGETVLRKPFTGVELERAVRGRLLPVASATQRDGDPLIRRLRSPELLAAYLFWRAARNGDRPPRLPDLNWGGLPQAANAFTAAIEPAGNTVNFRFLHVGAALEGRLGRRLGGTLVSELGGPAQDDEVLGSLEGSYRRCARTQAPSYEYASYDFGDGAPVMFERLILPVSDDGHRLTHLVGIALFTENARTN
jgi:PAS domain S-box-containing protein